MTPTWTATATPSVTPTRLPTSTPPPTFTPSPPPLALTVQVFPLATRPPQITIVPQVNPRPTSASILATITLAPTSTAQPSVTPLPIPPAPPGFAPTTSPPTQIANLPGGPSAILLQDAFLVDPNTLGIRRAPLGSESTLDVDVGPDGQVAAVEQVDAEHPGLGYVLDVAGTLLNGSPLPSATIRFRAVRWSPDGSRVAFIAETPGARGDGNGRIGATPSDGLWVWTLTPDQPSQDTHQALLNRYAYEYGVADARIVRDFAWAPDGGALLVELDREGGFPGQVALITPDWNAGDPPPLLPHEDGSWGRDGQRILVSGMMTDTGPILGWVDRDSHALTPLVDGRTLTTPLWMQDAVELPDGRIAFLGAIYSLNDPNGGRNAADVGLYIFNPANVEPVRVAYLGGGPILTADWNARRTAVLVRLADGRTLIVQTSGNVLDVTGTVGAGFVGWGE